MEYSTNILTNDISNHFNKELEKNTRNALYNIGIDFINDNEFYTFVRNNVININHVSNPYNFELRLKSGEYLLKYSHEPVFNFDNLSNGSIHANFGNIEVVNRKK